MLLTTLPARLFAVATTLCCTLLGAGFVPALAAEAASTTSEPQQMAPAQAGAIASDPAGKSPKEPPLPTQYGISAEYGYSYDPPPGSQFMLARLSAVYDYGSVWHQDCPNTLRFKVEGAAGSEISPKGKLILSVNMLALKYPVGLEHALRPYLEGGIGVIYTQLRVPGQGLHFNFNPVLGAGLELPQPDGKHLFAAIRLYHLSNASLYHDNRGVNSAALQIGRFF